MSKKLTKTTGDYKYTEGDYDDEIIMEGHYKGEYLSLKLSKKAIQRDMLEDQLSNSGFFFGGVKDKAHGHDIRGYVEHLFKKHFRYWERKKLKEAKKLYKNEQKTNR